MTDPDHVPDSTKPPPDRLHRLEAVLKADVAEAEAMRPLVDSAKAVPAVVRSRIKRALPLLALITLGVIVVVSGLYDELSMEALGRHHRTLVDWVAVHPLIAGITITAALATIISTGLPGGAVIVVASGLLFGIGRGALIAVIGDVVGASLLYFAARRFFVDEGAKPPVLVERIRGGFRSNPVSFAFFIRLVPVFPFGACSVALAWLGCSLRLFLTATTLGAIPSAVIYAAIGSGLATTIAAEQAVSLGLLTEPRFAVPLLSLAVLALLPALLGLRRKPADTPASPGPGA